MSGRLALVACLATALAACGSSAADKPAATATATGGGCPTGRDRASVPGAPLDTILRVPAKARGHRAPLVVALHFASGTGAEMEQATQLTPEARKRGFVVAYPSASANHFWSPADLPKLQQTIAAVERAACVDRTRVYALGMSNGGGMGGLVACRMAGSVAAVALFAPATGFADTCSPSRPIPVLHVQGTSDPIVPYGDGRRFIAAWAARDGCAPAPRSSRVTAKVTRLRWPGCRGGVSVQHLRLDRGRHIQLFGDLRRAGVVPMAAAWRFLRQYRLSAPTGR
jgi:polyhydroxybutyrate depolymerase